MLSLAGMQAVRRREVWIELKGDIPWSFFPILGQLLDERGEVYRKNLNKKNR